MIKRIIAAALENTAKIHGGKLYKPIGELIEFNEFEESFWYATGRLNNWPKGHMRCLVSVSQGTWNKLDFVSACLDKPPDLITGRIIEKSLYLMVAVSTQNKTDLIKTVFDNLIIQSESESVHQE